MCADIDEGTGTSIAITSGARLSTGTRAPPKHTRRLSAERFEEHASEELSVSAAREPAHRTGGPWMLFGVTTGSAQR
jgi:hypothetical protein